MAGNCRLCFGSRFTLMETFHSETILRDAEDTTSPGKATTQLHVFFATLRGPGRVWLQSLPLSRLANRIIAAVPGLTKGGREDGSILGRVGNLLDGDNS